MGLRISPSKNFFARTNDPWDRCCPRFPQAPVAIQNEPGTRQSDWCGLWKITIFNGKTHYKWPFSIAMLLYQWVTDVLMCCQRCQYLPTTVLEIDKHSGTEMLCAPSLDKFWDLHHVSWQNLCFKGRIPFFTDKHHVKSPWSVEKNPKFHPFSMKMSIFFRQNHHFSR